MEGATRSIPRLTLVPMAMGRRGGHKRQPSMWVSSSELPRSAGNPFYERLNRVLDEAGFDAFVEEQCAKFYADGVGRPSLAPGRYFRMLLLGYFEGLDSERAITWRAADSLSLRQYLDVELHEVSPDHSTVSGTRRRRRGRPSRSPGSARSTPAAARWSSPRTAHPPTFPTSRTCQPGSASCARPHADPVSSRRTAGGAFDLCPRLFVLGNAGREDQRFAPLGPGAGVRHRSLVFFPQHDCPHRRIPFLGDHVRQDPSSSASAIPSGGDLA